MICYKRSCLEEIRFKEIKKLNLDLKLSKIDTDCNNMTIPSPNLILWDFSRYNISPECLNNMAELNNLMKKEKTLYFKNLPSYTNTSIQIEPKVCMSGMNSNISVFNNTNNQINYDNNNNCGAIEGGFNNDLTRQLLNICNNEKLFNSNLNNQLINLINNHSMSNTIQGQSNLNNIISKLAPNKMKSDENNNLNIINSFNENNNLNKKRVREESMVNLENLLKKNQTIPNIPNQQNQIFIINQYNKDSLSSMIESTLLNILCNNKNTQSLPPTNPINNFMNNGMNDGFNNYNNALMNIKNFIMNNNNNTNLNNNISNIKVEDLIGLINSNKVNEINKSTNNLSNLVNHNNFKQKNENESNY